MSIFGNVHPDFLWNSEPSIRRKLDESFTNLSDFEAFVAECGVDIMDDDNVLDVAERLAYMDTANIAELVEKHRHHVIACIRHERSDNRYRSDWSNHIDKLTELTVEEITRAIELYPTAVSNWHTVDMTLSIHRLGVPFEYAAALPWDQAYLTPRGFRPAEMAELHLLGIPAEFASAVASSFASIEKIAQMYRSGLAVEYAIEVFS